MNDRQNELLQLVNARGRIQVAELVDMLKVSGVTIRQDLTLLENKGYLKRVHGAAIARDFDNIDSRLEVLFDVKQRIAQAAADLVAPNETVLIEGGSTNSLLAQLLAKRGDVTMITPSAYIAHLVRGPSVHVILLGGVYQAQSESMVGPLTRLCIEHVHFSTAFLGIDGFHPDTGFTNRDMMRAEIASAILHKNRRNILISDSSKFGKIYPTTLTPLSKVALVITDSDVSHSHISEMEALGLTVLSV